MRTIRSTKAKFFFILLFLLFVIHYYCFRFLPQNNERITFVNINDHYNSTYILNHFASLHCTFARPCSYNDEVDLRVIVLTFSRRGSLEKLLRSLSSLKLDGHKAAMEIWVDRDEEGRVCLETLQMADSYVWSKGTKRVTVQRHHAGIYGQWINSWRPRGKREIALFVEDDMSVSPHVYRWLRRAHAAYSHRKDFAGVSLNGGDQLIAHNTGKAFQANTTAFMYACVGTWGFSPQRQFWADFQDWYHDLLNQGRVAMMQVPSSCYGGWCPPHNNNSNSKMAQHNNPLTSTNNIDNYIPYLNPSNTNLTQATYPITNTDTFHPYVPDVLPTKWYMKFEEEGKSNTMWEMWFIYYASLHHRFTLYSFLNAAFPSPDELTRYIKATLPRRKRTSFFDVTPSDLCLGVNRKEVGLHYDSSSFSTTCLLVDRWLPLFDALPKRLSKYDWDGNVIAID